MSHQTPATMVSKGEAAQVADGGVCGGYDPAFFEPLARIEENHFWFRSRNRLISKLARRITSELPSGQLVLEVGCGTGNVLRELRKACPHAVVIGLELWGDGLRYAQRRSVGPLVQGDIRHSPFGRPCALIGMFDVLEHIPDDRETLAYVWNSLAPGGRLLLTVPAHQFLWSYFDEASHHCRRYSEREICAKMMEARFEVEFISPFMATIFPIVWLVRKLGNGSTRAKPETIHARATSEFRMVPVVNQILTALLTLEADWVAGGRRLPFGTSLVVVARKPA